MSSKIKSDLVPIKKIPSADRITNLNKLFVSEYDCEPSFYVRVPGRVNIIGEHIDYCGYPVLPMALEQDILIAVGKLNKPEIILKNTNEKYSSYNTTITTFEELDIHSSGKPFWYNYVLCGIKGSLEYLKNSFEYGLQMYFDGNVPPASGLSSSSALVSASCLAFLYAQNTRMSKTDIASLCAVSERYIGTQGGGMDQAIAFLGEKYAAQYITFNPLKAKSVPLPEDAAFVVAHSLAEANKAATNDYNRRVMECRLAAKILAIREGLETDKKIITLSQLQTSLDKSLEEMIDLVKKHLPKDNFTRGEISSILNITEEELCDWYLSDNTKHVLDYKLKQRALHVYEEALRVEMFRKTCSVPFVNGNHENGNKSNGVSKNGNGKAYDMIDTLGDLMYKSHMSLKNLYECSHENLDMLVDLSKGVGVNARLTGAGWGGCVVAICRKNEVDNYIKSIIDKFYVKHHSLNENDAKSYIFATTPNQGATIFEK